ncbi:HNH endonuclease [Streptomyces sp. NPDC005402]|uniref:HNH endonuclease n=1 Tax=Streptomyces sp. NPDC005402 TaxID=3155338 RepID=UPI0033A4DB36
MSHRPPHLNSHRRRARKQRLAARDGAQCYYCRRSFRELREATADHIAPVSLWRSWSLSSLVLACRPCNDAKADRFPLSLALVLLAWADPTRPIVRPVDWPLLAQLAHANKSAYEAVWSPDPIPFRSTPDLRDEPRHTPRHGPARVAARPDCLRAPRPVRVCAGPTGEAVSA